MPIAATVILTALAATDPTVRAEASGRVEEIELRDLQGLGQLVIVHFWATWCAPCTEEIPALVAFYEGGFERLRARGVELVAVSNDVRSRDLDFFLDRQSLPFPVYLDSLGDLNDDLALTGIPATVILGRDGRVRDRLYGAQPWGSVEFFERIASHLESEEEPGGERNEPGG